ncbi:MAG TPA: hypothetical protein VH724_06545 [Candidatus Angelobacter sp.]|nr:hypothetical protein [Candidatus Angelobacter sp.]
MTEPIERRRNWMPGAALLLALAAMLCNGVFFLGLPGQKAIPLLSLALAFAAVVCAVIGVMRAFRQSQIYRGKILSPVLGTFSVLICALAVVGFIHSRDLPAPTEAPRVGQKAPDFTLADTNGKNVSLSALLGNSGGTLPGAGTAANVTGANNWKPRAVLLIFYRGYW